MIDVPKNAYNQVIESGITRGCVIRTLYQFGEEDRKFKYFVSIGNTPSNDPLFFVITTSKPAFFDKHPQYEQDIVRIPKGVFDFFPEETILDCKRVFRHTKDALKESFENKDLKFCGYLTDDYVSKIDEIIKKSRHIPLKDKKCIFDRGF